MFTRRIMTGPARRRGLARAAFLLVIATISFAAGVASSKIRASRPPLRRGPASPAGVAARPPMGPRAAVPQPRPKAAAAELEVLPMPGEFEKQAALLLGTHEVVFFSSQLFVDIVAAVHKDIRVVCLVADEGEIDLAKRLLAQAGLPKNAAQFINLPMDTPWVRDYGPLFVQRRDRSVAIVNLDYREWGSKEDRGLDDNMPNLFGELLGLPVVDAPLTMSGGNLLSNGDGLCVTTVAAAIALRKEFKGGEAVAVTEEEMQPVLEAFGKYFGFRKWICFNVLKGEPTGDVDMFVTFTAPDVAVVSRLDPAVDAVNAAVLDEAAAKLAGVQTSRGPMRVYRIPMPPRQEGRWRSYNNVVFANGTLLMPRYADEDPEMLAEAMYLYARLLPGWKIVGVGADSLTTVNGFLHCITRNVPWFVPPPKASKAFEADG